VQVVRLCVDQPNEWHRFLDALLFAYREVPQESTEFSPFKLLYGRPVHGLMNLLRELWSADGTKPEILSSYCYVFELRESLEEEMYDIVKSEATKSQSRYLSNFNAKNKVKQNKTK